MDNTSCIISTGFSPSDSAGHSSFCSILAGIYAILFTLQTILPTTSWRPHFQLACDGKLVLSRLKWLQLTDPQEPHADLMISTRMLLKISAVQVKFVHVKRKPRHKNYGTIYKRPHAKYQSRPTSMQTNQLHEQTNNIPYSVEPRGLLYRVTQSQAHFGSTIQDHINGLTTKAYWGNGAKWQQESGKKLIGSQ